MKKKLAIISVLLTIALIFSGFHGAMLYGTQYMQSKPGYLYSISSAADWWDCNWSYCKKITIDHNKVDTDQTNYPVMIYRSADSDLATYTQSDGADIAFLNQYNTTQYNHEIEKYDSSTGELIAWIKVTSVSSTTDTILYMYYGNPTSSNQTNMVETWDSNYVMVHHLEDPSGTIVDSTSSYNNGTNNGAAFNATSKIDGGYDFDGNDNITVSDASSLDITGQITLEGWIKDPPWIKDDDETIVQIIDKREEQRIIFPGKPFSVERTVRTNKQTDLIFVALYSSGIKIQNMYEGQNNILEKGYEKDNPNSNIEKTIENIRKQLPDKLKELENIAYSKTFTTNSEKTIKMSFESKTNNLFNDGKISYLVISSDGTYDYESTTHWKILDHLRNIIQKYPQSRALLEKIFTDLKYVKIDAEDAKNIVDSYENVLILDFRNEDSYNSGHVDRAISVTLDDLACSSCFQKLLKDYKNSKIIVYGDNEVEVKKAYDTLFEGGYNLLYYLTDDIESWKNAGFNIITSQAEINVETEIDQSLNNGKSTLLFFYSNGCGYCQDQKPVLTDLSESYADELDIVYLHNNENPNNFDRYNVKSYPTMFLVVGKDKDGYIYKDFSGFKDKDMLVSFFDMALDKSNYSAVFESWWHGPIEPHRPLGLPLQVAARVSHGENAQVIIRYKDGRSFAEETSHLESLGFVPTTEISSKGLIAGTINKSIYEKIKYDSDILAVYPDENFTVLLDESLPLIRFDEAVEDFNVTGSGKKICILDTGVDASLVNYSYGYDFVNDDNIPDDEYGHGTKVAAVIKSIAPDAELVVAKVIGSTGIGYESTVLEALEWCIAQNPDVISFGIGSQDTCSGFCDFNFVASMANSAVDEGIFVVAASGNDGLNRLKSPACGSKVFSVGATDDNDNIAGFSNVNPTLDMFAPGVDIETKAGSGSGTSFSAPFVAGAALLVLENENLIPMDLKYRLRSTGVPINYTYNETLSLSIPRLDIFNALANNVTMEPYNYSWWWQDALRDGKNYGPLPLSCETICQGKCGAGWTGACEVPGSQPPDCGSPCTDGCHEYFAGCGGATLCICHIDSCQAACESNCGAGWEGNCAVTSPPPFECWPGSCSDPCKETDGLPWCSASERQYCECTESNAAPEAEYADGAQDIYAGKKATTFETRHTDRDGDADIDDCRILVGQEFSMNQFILNWNVDDDVFTITYGSNWVSISGCTVSENWLGGDNGVILTWQFIPDWDFPYDDQDFDVGAWTDDESGENSGEQWDEAGTTYNEEDLEVVSFTASIDEKYEYGDVEGQINDTDWFRGGHAVTATGTVEYEGSSQKFDSIYCPNVEVQLFYDTNHDGTLDDLGDTYRDTSIGDETSGFFSIPAYTPSASPWDLQTNAHFNVSVQNINSTGSDVTSGDIEITSKKDNENSTISSPTVDESSDYINSSGTTIYYGDDMGSAQSFTVQGSSSDGSGSGLWIANFTTTTLGDPSNDTSSASWSGLYNDVDSGDTWTGSITVTIYDNVNNTKTTTFTVNRDTTNPDVNITDIPDGTTGPTNITGNATDNVWVSDVYLYIKNVTGNTHWDGSAWTTNTTLNPSNISDIYSAASSLVDWYYNCTDNGVTWGYNTYEVGAWTIDEVGNNETVIEMDTFTLSAGTNEPPYATNLQIHSYNDFTLNNLNTTWTFNDNESNGELDGGDGHTYEWYEGPTSTGSWTTMGLNTSSLDKNYTNESKYYYFSVLPRDDGGSTDGDTYNSTSFQVTSLNETAGVYSDTYTEAGNLTIGNNGVLTITGITSITGNLTIEHSGNLDLGDNNHDIGSLTVTSDSTLTATSGKIYITNENTTSTYAIDLDGTYTNSSGLIQINTTSATEIDLIPTTGTIYDLNIKSGNTVDWNGNTMIGDDLTISSGTFQPNSASDTIDVTDDATVSGGTLGGNTASGTWTMGSLTQSSGTIDATTGTIIILSETAGGYALDLDGTLTANTGTIEINTNADTNIDIDATGDLYKLIVDTSDYTVTSDAAATVSNNLTIQAGQLEITNSLTVAEMDINNGGEFEIKSDSAFTMTGLLYQNGFFNITLGNATDINLSSTKFDLNNASQISLHDTPSDPSDPS
ncbi:MAG: DUF2341 domain-containing protein, partial [Thermoplasmatales archaeon]|nr:DUF2341 domain-containing protein [Thermoplasmatales archaeon]